MIDHFKGRIVIADASTTSERNVVSLPGQLVMDRVTDTIKTGNGIHVVSQLPTLRVGHEISDATGASISSRKNNNWYAETTLGPSNRLFTQGNQFVKADGTPVRFRGAVWGGMDRKDLYTPYGLWIRPWRSLCDDFIGMGLNTVRLGVCDNMTLPDQMPVGINYGINADLQGLNAMQVIDLFMDYFRERGVYVIMSQWGRRFADQSDETTTGTPIADDYTFDDWARTWTFLAKRYVNYENFVGIDPFNEPYRLDWDTWVDLVERLQPLVHAVNPHLIFIVEGVTKVDGDFYSPGSNLTGVRRRPVTLTVPNKLAYSIHEYGQGIVTADNNYRYHTDPSIPVGWPDNLRPRFDHYWGFVFAERIAPLYMGEFGGSFGFNMDGALDPTYNLDSPYEREWFGVLKNYLEGRPDGTTSILEGSELGISFTYFPFQANAPAIGALLCENWFDWQLGKMDFMGLWTRIWAGATSTPSPTIPVYDIYFEKNLLDSSLAFVNTSGGSTVTDVDGQIVVLGTNSPRFDHTTVTARPRGLLLEPYTKNYALHSADLVGWSLIGVSKTHTYTAPIGNTGQRLVEDLSSEHYAQVGPAIAVSAGTQFAFSIFVRPARRSQQRFLKLFDAVTGAGVRVDIYGGKSTALGAAVASGTQEYKNGWYRCWFSYVAASTTSDLRAQIVLKDADLYVGDGISGLYLTGAQFVVSHNRNSYIPSTTTAGERFPDTVLMSGSEFNAWYSTSCAIVIEADVLVPDTGVGTLLSLNDGTINNSIDIQVTSDGNIIINTVRAGVSTLKGSQPLPAGGHIRMCMNLPPTHLSWSLNGVYIAGGITLLRSPPPTQMTLGSRVQADYLSGWIRRVRVFNAAMTEDSITAFTKI